MKRVLWAALALVGAASAHGQLVISDTSTTSGSARATYYDIATNTSTVLWNSGSNNSAYGIVADDDNGKLWFTTGARVGADAGRVAMLVPGRRRCRESPDSILSIREHLSRQLHTRRRAAATRESGAPAPSAQAALSRASPAASSPASLRARWL